MERELKELGGMFPGNFDVCSVIWFVIADEPIDQNPAGKASNLLAGSARHGCRNAGGYCLAWRDSRTRT